MVSIGSVRVEPVESRKEGLTMVVRSPNQWVVSTVIGQKDRQPMGEMFWG